MFTNKTLYTITQSFLEFNNILILEKTSHFTPSMFQMITENAANLRKIVVTDCSWMNDQLLRPVLKNNNLLTYLDLSYCDGFTDGILQVRMMFLQIQFMHKVINNIEAG